MQQKLKRVTYAEMDIIQLVKSRGSVRKFKPIKVPREVIRAILDAARWAPSAHNSQPWRIIVIDKDGVKEKLAVEMGKTWILDMQRNGVPLHEAEKIAEEECWSRVTKSPLVIIVCLTMEDMHKYPDSKRKKAEYLMAVQSVAAYIQNMLLLAHHYGLGACWICAPLFCPNAVRNVLDLPHEIEPQAMIILGYPDENPEPPPRKALNEICVFNRWPSTANGQ